MANDIIGQIKTGVAGQDVGMPSAKSTVSADVVASQITQQKQDLMAQAQEAGQKQKQQIRQVQLADSLSAEQLKQRENSMLQSANRQINDIIFKAEQQGKQLDVEKDAAAIEQLTFLNNLSNRKWADHVKAEGTKRRLDNEMQMKEALMYANFNDMISLLNSDLSFKAAMNADERKFQEYIANITPEAALSAALQMQRDEASARSVKGAVAGVTGGVQKFAESGGVKRLLEEDTSWKGTEAPKLYSPGQTGVERQYQGTEFTPYTPSKALPGLGG